MSSPFEVLGVEPDADEATIVRAYRRRVKETHPDQGGSAREFQAVKEAYERIRAGDVDSEPAADDDKPAARRAESAGGGSRDSTSGGAQDSTENRENADRSDTPASGPDADRDAATTSRVEFVNHAVLDDHGWALDDEDLFEKAADADLAPEDHGAFEVEPGESLLEAAERHGFAWPFSCRGGACANCAVLLREGELSQPADHILPEELIEENIRLSCNGEPLTDELQVVYNVKHLPRLESLRLPPGPFEFSRTD
ncbi:ferredoxin Fer [Halobacterium zhouii]|uniref:ferredoxin Fer n=1 Tax=Halobacterium zhouii TaxID=2902624 RepID=UPI001E2D28EF|nr:ferredoxin Fer [Halobacterium zhouii]